MIIIVSEDDEHFDHHGVGKNEKKNEYYSWLYIQNSFCENLVQISKH